MRSSNDASPQPCRRCPRPHPVPPSTPPSRPASSTGQRASPAVVPATTHRQRACGYAGRGLQHRPPPAKTRHSSERARPRRVVMRSCAQRWPGRAGTLPRRCPNPSAPRPRCIGRRGSALVPDAEGMVAMTPECPCSTSCRGRYYHETCYWDLEMSTGGTTVPVSESTSSSTASCREVNF